MPTARLLLVEDEPGLQLTLSDRLSAEGYSVETAGDGDTAIRRAGGEPFDHGAAVRSIEHSRRPPRRHSAGGRSTCADDRVEVARKVLERNDDGEGLVELGFTEPARSSRSQ